MVSAPAKPPSEAARYCTPAAPVAARSSLPSCKSPESPESVNRQAAVSRQSIEVIRKRADFLAANRGKRFVTPGFVLLAHKRRNDHDIPPATIRYGITVTKKIGNAVTRNRMKRRFRALVARILPAYGMEGVDHILIGRKENAERNFSEMEAELEKGLKHLAKKLAAKA